MAWAALAAERNDADYVVEPIVRLPDEKADAAKASDGRPRNS